MVLAARFGALEQFGGGGALIGFEPRIAAQTDERVRFLDARGHQPAGAVIFEAAPQHHLARAQKRRSQRIARIA